MKKVIYPFLIILIPIPAIAPLLQTGYFVNHEEFFPMFRLYELYRGLEAGYIFPRWGPDWAWGFGYPFFNFYAPLSYYFAALWRLLGFGLIDSIKIVFGASIILSGFTMYLWAKEYWGRNGGLVSAAAYMYLPYRFADIYTRGNLAEAFAFVWLPLILYAIHKIITNKKPSSLTTNYSLLLSVSLAALILTHNLTAIYFLPILIVYTIFLIIVRANPEFVEGEVENSSKTSPREPIDIGSWSKNNMKSLLHVACYMLLGFGLSAFFWFPALYDMRFVRTQDMVQMWYLPIQFLWSTVGHTEHFDFLKQQFYPIHGILIVAGIIFVSCHSGIRRQANVRNPYLYLDSRLRGNDRGCRGNDNLWNTIFSILIITILIFFISPLSQPVWEALPVQFHYIQFSWRLLIYVGLFVSFLCGSLLYKLPVTSYQLPVTILFIIWIIASATPRLQTMYAPTIMTDADITIERSWDWDARFGTIGNTAQSEYLPKWVNAEVFRKIASACHPERSEGSRDEGCGIANRESQIRNNFEKDKLLSFNIFYFPGWSASIDGKPAQIQPQDKTGFIQVPVPAGDHEVKIWFGNTSWRWWSGVVSLMSLLGMLIVIILRLDPMSIGSVEKFSTRPR